jgi:threonine dehydratase
MVTLGDIENAARIIQSSIVKTPLVHSVTLSNAYGADIFLKLENLQNTGSFKIRGATCKILRHRHHIPAGGVVAASAGNHAQGVASAATRAGIPSTIVMPTWVSIPKQEATQGYGGEIILYGSTIQKSVEKAQTLAENGRTFIHPFDDKDIIAGQGTIGLEILSDLADADMIVVPVGGGGLIAGIAAAARSIRPDIRIVGVQSAACPSAYEAMKSGAVGQVESAPSIADGINVRKTGEIPFELMRKFVDEIVLAGEAHIASAVLMLLERKKVLAEGAGAVPLAALMGGRLDLQKGGKVVLVISGGNVDSPLLGRIINHGLMKNSRILHIEVRLQDRPGSLAELLNLLADLEVNVLDISHERHEKKLPFYVSRVHMVLETRNAGHIEKISTAIKDGGFEMEAID